MDESTEATAFADLTSRLGYSWTLTGDRLAVHNRDGILVAERKANGHARGQRRYYLRPVNEFWTICDSPGPDTVSMVTVELVVTDRTARFGLLDT